MRDELRLWTAFDQHGELGLVVFCARVGVGVEGDFDGGDPLAGCGDLGDETGLDCVLVGWEDVGYGPTKAILVEVHGIVVWRG